MISVNRQKFICFVFERTFFYIPWLQKYLSLGRLKSLSHTIVRWSDDLRNHCICNCVIIYPLKNFKVKKQVPKCSLKSLLAETKKRNTVRNFTIIVPFYEQEFKRPKLQYFVPYGNIMQRFLQVVFCMREADFAIRSNCVC